MVCELWKTPVKTPSRGCNEKTNTARGRVTSNRVRHIKLILRYYTIITIACSRLSVSEDNRKSERAKSGISGERDPGETPLVARLLFQSSTDREPGTGYYY